MTMRMILVVSCNHNDKDDSKMVEIMFAMIIVRV